MVVDYLFRVNHAALTDFDVVSVEDFPELVIFGKVFVLQEFVNHSPAARALQILLVFYQHPAWFISL